MGVLIGVICAAGAAFVTNLGFLLRHRGAVAAPDVEVRHPWRSAVALFRQKWWTIGFALAFAAWVFHVAGMALAPLSIVQATLASGYIFLAVLADRMFGYRIGRREWIGLGLTTVGLIFLALTSGQISGDSQSDFGRGAMIAFEAALVLSGALLVASPASIDGDRVRGLLLGLGAGLLFTLTHVAIKGLTGAVAFGPGPGLEVVLSQPVSIVGPLPILIVGGAIIAFFASARSLQLGDAVPVIAVTSIAGNASAILAGVVVFNDPLGSDALEVTARVVAFALVVVAAAFIPGPLRAARRSAQAGNAS